MPAFWVTWRQNPPRRMTCRRTFSNLLLNGSRLDRWYVHRSQQTKGNIAKLAEGFAARMPKARFVGVPDTGHIPHLESPAAFRKAVLEFLR